MIRSGPALALSRSLLDVLQPEASPELIAMVADRIMIAVQTDELKQRIEQKQSVLTLIARKG